jgi:hypothetical protein
MHFQSCAITRGHVPSTHVQLTIVLPQLIDRTILTHFHRRCLLEPMLFIMQVTSRTKRLHLVNYSDWEYSWQASTVVSLAC